MSTIDLDRHGSWTLDTAPDHDGELALEYTEDPRYSPDASVYLGLAKLRTLRDVIDRAISECPCAYVHMQFLGEEFAEYQLGAIDPECPFHGEKP